MTDQTVAVPSRLLVGCGQDDKILKTLELTLSKGRGLTSADLDQLDKVSDPYSCVLALCCTSEGKVLGLAAALLNTFLGWVSERPLLPAPSQETQDLVFHRFSRQPSPVAMRAAFLAFSLVGKKCYKPAIEQFCLKDGDYKTACEAAVALEMFDWFPVRTFCLPLLLLNKATTMEVYLERSPQAARELVAFLDTFMENNLEKVGHLCSSYPDIAPVGSNRFLNKSLDKMIKKYVEAFSVPTSLIPQTCAKRASADLYYWVKQMFTEDEHSFSLDNWRQFIEKRVGSSQELRHQLINNLFNFDITEAQHWNEVFGFNYFDIQETEGQEDWETETVLLKDKNHNLAVPFKNEVPPLDGDPDEEWNELGENTNLDEDDKDKYYKMKISNDKIVFVNTEDAFKDFLKTLGTEDAVGVDAEFVPPLPYQDQKISLLQVATLYKVFLLDFEVLPNVLTAQDFRDLSTGMFQNPNLVKVGFGLDGDIRLLARTVPCLKSLPEMSRAVLSLDTVRLELTKLLEMEQGGKGLSGFCEAAFGRPLDKLDQVSDW